MKTYFICSLTDVYKNIVFQKLTKLMQVKMSTVVPCHLEVNFSNDGLTYCITYSSQHVNIYWDRPSFHVIIFFNFSSTITTRVLSGKFQTNGLPLWTGCEILPAPSFTGGPQDCDDESKRSIFFLLRSFIWARRFNFRLTSIGTFIHAPCTRITSLMSGLLNNFLLPQLPWSSRENWKMTVN